ncbi:unnamed protein product [Ceratitis capitata]|uniref:(Mediterranean fruit fly) hypothetical protein n=1 Tax=Ceratitis capitata TaxID=7213 RepID=A0A811V696_CERCA|nr:unnamed protein product [Ceratitis capitata]
MFFHFSGKACCGTFGPTLYAMLKLYHIPTAFCWRGATTEPCLYRLTATTISPQQAAEAAIVILVVRQQQQQQKYE